MTNGYTFALYVGRRLATTALLVLAAAFALVFIIDFIELLRRAGDSETATIGGLAILAAERTPTVMEQVFPFAILFAAMISFLQLSRRLELVVARATGLSVWQIIAPALIVAALLGIVATGLFNPVSANLKESANAREAYQLGRSTAQPSRRWIRQRSVDGQSILRADTSYNRGRDLVGVSAFIFSSGGAFQERVDARSAHLEEGMWRLIDARVLRPGAEPQSHETYLVATNLTASQVAENLASAEAIAFWDLPDVITRSEQSGLPVTRFELQYHTLLAQPALFVTMVLIAATVSLRFFRMGGIARVILGGVIAGFVLYVVTKLAQDLGASGFVAPAIAAWTPAIVGGMLSVTVLLHQEDG